MGQNRMSDEEYAECGGMKCPFCRGEEIEGGCIDADGPVGESLEHCLSCDRLWASIWKPVGYYVDHEEGDND